MSFEIHIQLRGLSLNLNEGVQLNNIGIVGWLFEF